MLKGKLQYIKYKSKMRLRDSIILLRMFWLRNSGMSIHKTARVSLKANLDHTNPHGIFIGEETYVGGTLVSSHDFVRKIRANTSIGKRCFIGMNSVILPGIHIGDHSIVGAGSVVTKDVPPNTIVAGNPAKIIRRDIKTGKYGQLI